jgi:hypothetical protein
MFPRLFKYLASQRKLILAHCSLWSGFYLVLKDKDITGFAILVGAILAFYGGANVMEKHTMFQPLPTAGEEEKK